MTLNLSRRKFIAAGAALATLGAGRGWAATPIDLHTRVADVQLLPEKYGQTRIWGFEGRAPGPEIRVAQGARVQRRLINDLPDATSTHWHGIRIGNAMDGVAGLTQDAIAPGASFQYDFVAPDAGTYWYHAHNRSFEQVARGLHGALIVEEPEPIDIDRDEVLILDDWLVDPETAQIADTFRAMHDLSHAGRLGNYITTNATYNLALPVKRHERLRLRMINAANARVFQLALDGLEGWIVALDGMPLAQARLIDRNIVLAPAQRVDLIVDVTAETGGAGHIVQIDRNESFSQVAFEVTGDATRARRDAPRALPPNVHAMPDLAEATKLELLMQGGAMGGMMGAMMGGQMSSMRDMMQSGNFWAFNGAVGGMDGAPLAAISRGETVRLKINNDTAFPHAMHLHGMHFHEIAPDGSLGTLRDTTLLDRGEVRDIAFVADNPGKWLLHCHMLSHSASGMMTWIDVA
ncbi:multicopper oxidase family protein [Sulfitobacter mediterraneus]|uniref:FtsP/CotA-like multicopper oxidase with cupredoxin domain n=1 Tax=Sulfitobacter mediterraneus TaxID=83219 RepID=A0A2T6CB87_9RHOB|nr:multicopper oxidase family protein [Sulfitobacter mediterraneus]KIN76951.1 putative copper resistance protein A [Sulfitobacter mediterraneus KCTC 32188]PTX72761.1 FtsP/CotA-like multicopper oxidase with cupredoxin domain [Sulfitobacter mediterraneus]